MDAPRSLSQGSLADRIDKTGSRDNSSASVRRVEPPGAPAPAPAPGGEEGSAGAEDTISEAEQKQLLGDLLRGVAYLHSLGIVHRDLKPQNVLVTAEGRLKISDMGLSKRLDSDQSSFETVSSGTWGWRAPELVLGERCTRAVDLFAVGCIFFYVLTGPPPPHPPRTSWTRCVPHPVLVGHAASLTPY